MRPEPWLRGNSRPLRLALIPPLVLIAAGIWLMWGAPWWTLRIVAGISMGAGLVMFLSVTMWLRMPRLAYRQGRLLAYLRMGTPVAIPIEVVECFFLGRSPVESLSGRGQTVQSADLLVRLSESARDWHDIEIKPVLGKWQGNMITIRGLWCEPLTPALLVQLNGRLVQAKRSLVGDGRRA